MKIRAIRLKEVGRFSEPIALEGLSGGLDVLAGPNELGKSTILKAVKLALCEKHTSKDRKTVEALRPHAGGAPLVEVDFEIDGKSWRIRKQFLAGRSAELLNLRSGEISRGGDAETRLAELLAGTDAAGDFALLWVDQGATLAPFKAATADGALLSAVEEEVESVADGGATRFVAARLRAELGELVTGHNPPRPTGRYKAALDEQRDLAARRETARSRLSGAQGRLDRLEVVREKIARLADPAAIALRGQAKADAERAFEAARAAHEKLRLAEEALARHEERFAACEAALASIKAKIADLSKLEEARSREAAQLQSLTQRLGQEDGRTEAARKKRDEIKEALAVAEREGKARDNAARLREVGERLAAARSAAGERKDLAKAIAANGAEDGLLAAARRAAQSIATLSARLAAAAPKVSITYAAGGAGKIRIGGKAVAHGATTRPTQPITLEIEGVGVITVAPGQSEGAGDDTADMAAHAAQLRDLLRKMGAASLEEAERRADERRALQARLAEASAQLQAHAPDGIERLEAAARRPCQARCAARACPDPQPGGAGFTRTGAGRGAERRPRSNLAGAVATRDETRMGEVKQRTLAAERGDHIKRLAADLGDAAACKAKTDKLAAALVEVTASRNAAVRDLTAWRDAAPDEARFAALKRAAEAATAAVSAAEHELSELRRTEAGIEGELKADRADDVGSTVAELDEACTAADERVCAFAQELGALRLLASEIDKASGETRERFAKPVLDRLEPYLRLVFPDARLRFGDAFTLETLQRGSAAEPVATLSEGTREQLAVLVRLGFGRLLAEAGNAAPLILDDALVYSDDARIERMFEALKLASRSHQVLVLTCRQRTFESLGGNRVAIAPWR